MLTAQVTVEVNRTVVTTITKEIPLTAIAAAAGTMWAADEIMHDYFPFGGSSEESLPTGEGLDPTVCCLCFMCGERQQPLIELICW